MILADHITVARRFRRSVRIDRDMDAPDALDGFICHQSNREVLENMGRLIASGQNAFTWTGPYGGGKSSLALALAGLVSGNGENREKVLHSIDKNGEILKSFPVGKDPWLFVPVAGRRSDPIMDIREALSKAISAEKGRTRTRRRQVDTAGYDVIARLEDEARLRPNGGVLLIIDEMGQHLEYVRSNDVNIHFFQELAESAGRCTGQLVVLGILHQAFEQYASRLGRDIQNEWAKVQGRYVDIPMVMAVDEVIDLVGYAIQSKMDHPKSLSTSTVVADSITRYRLVNSDDLATQLDNCWPIHPVTAALLGPVSRSRFAQNNRSIFSFLSSAEPLGFQEYLREEINLDNTGYSPARLWDYLQVNLEPAIMASPDGHQWAHGVEAVERCKSLGSDNHTQIAKTIAIINLFRRSSSIVASPEILETLGGEHTAAILQDLEKWSVAIFRKHLGAWSLYEGSDFNINDALETARERNRTFDVSQLDNLVRTPPLLAKRHYHKTGTLRWFEAGLTDINDCHSAVSDFEPRKGSAGKFFLVIPTEESTKERIINICKKASEIVTEYPVAIGFPKKFPKLYDLGVEFMAHKEVATTNHELEGDAVARRELSTRIAEIKSRLEDELKDVFVTATWYVQGINRGSADGTPQSSSRLISELVDEAFKDAPIIQSELINRVKPSANGRAAVRKLLYHMVKNSSEENLAIEGFRAERGLYSTILSSAGLHTKSSEDTFEFRPPKRGSEVADSFIPVWNATAKYLKEKEGLVSLSNLYELWMHQPYGIRQGVLPILAMSFILTKENSIAVYAEEMFQHEVNDYVVDILLQDPGRIQLRLVNLDKKHTTYLRSLSKIITSRTGSVNVEADLLSVAREMVRFIFSLPAWTRRTLSVSKPAQEVRNILLHAKDPYQVLFSDLPGVFDTAAKAKIVPKLEEVFLELHTAYPAMLANLREQMLASLGHKGSDYISLHRRAKTVRGLTGDFQFDAFSTRLLKFSDDDAQMESIASLSIHKPPRDWTDRDAEQSALALADFALKFRHAEMLASVKDREPTRHAIGIVFGTGNEGHTSMKSFDVADAEEQEVQTLVKKINKELNGAGNKEHLALAAIAHVGMNLIQSNSDGADTEL